MEKNKKVLVIVGPTASGKTELSVIISKELDGEIISADSRQIYKYLDIGTAKPTRGVLNSCKHHFIDEYLPDEIFNAGEFGKQGRERIDQIFKKGKQPIVVGGSGLYVNSLIDGFFDAPSADDHVRKGLYERLHSEGSEKLLDELRKFDPDAASKMLPSNVRRIIRAIEVYAITGIPISKLQNEKIEISFRKIIIGLDWEREILYERINRRVDEMVSNGLIEEVKELKNIGYTSEINSLQTVGYQEVFMHLNGEIDYAAMVELIKRNSRRYAKRQLTWFRRDERIKWFMIDNDTDFSKLSTDIIKHFKNN